MPAVLSRLSILFVNLYIA